MLFFEKWKLILVYYLDFGIFLRLEKKKRKKYKSLVNS